MPLSLLICRRRRLQLWRYVPRPSIRVLRRLLHRRHVLHDLHRPIMRLMSDLRTAVRTVMIYVLAPATEARYACGADADETQEHAGDPEKALVRDRGRPMLYGMRNVHCHRRIFLRYSCFCPPLAEGAVDPLRCCLKQVQRCYGHWIGKRDHVSLFGRLLLYVDAICVCSMIQLFSWR